MHLQMSLGVYIKMSNDVPNRGHYKDNYFKSYDLFPLNSKNICFYSVDVYHEKSQKVIVFIPVMYTVGGSQT